MIVDRFLQLSGVFFLHFSGAEASESISCVQRQYECFSKVQVSLAEAFG